MWTDSEDFITQVAVRSGKLVKGGEPDINNVSKTIIYMWQQGKIPYFEKPPKTDPDAPQRTIE
jgi:nuclear GTP-binding protein